MSLRSERTRYLTASVLRMLASVLGMVLVGFLITTLFPDDAADVMAGRMGTATLESQRLLREHLGLSGPVSQRLLNYLVALAQFDLGFSPQYNASVMDLILQRLPNTLLLMLSAFVVSLVLGTLCGATMAIRPNSLAAKVISAVLLLFYSVPAFWIGLMLVTVFSVTLGWLPAQGAETIDAGLVGWARVVDTIRHLVLPVLALSPFLTAVLARLVRASLLEVARQDFMRTAWAKGLAPRHVYTRHLMRNALIPMSTAAGVSFASLLSGSVVVETVFAWPGLGRLAYESVQARDFNILMGILFFSALLVIFTNLLIDLLHGFLDPRIGQ